MLKLDISPLYTEELQHTGKASVVSSGKAPDKAVLLLPWNSQPDGLLCVPARRERDVAPGINSLVHIQINQCKF